MGAVPFETSNLLAILPEIGLVVLAVLVLALDLIWQHKRPRDLGLLVFGGLVVLAGLAMVFSRPAESQLLFGGMLRNDAAAYIFRLIFLLGAAVTVLFSMDIEFIGHSGEYYILLLISALGMSLMAASADLIMLFLAIETTSVPLYVLAGALTRDSKSAESGVKYLLFGLVTSTVMVYGFSLLYGFTGTTNIYTIAEKVQTGQFSPFALAGILALILAGFGFKISAVPFHFWAPDVYEGAPTPISGYLSTASKTAGFAVLVRFLFAALPDLAPSWTTLVAGFSVASMLLGNIVAMRQKNIKRLLAYSSIAHAGYTLIAVAANSDLGTTAAIFYLMSYLVTNLAAFGVVAVVGQATGSDEISAYAGLSRRSPALALVLLAALLSLGGIPPFSGFIGKLFVFAAGVQVNLVWLVILGILNSVFALYYYLVVLKVVYLQRGENENEPLRITRPWRLALAVCVVGMILLGTLFAPWYGWAAAAAAAF